MLRKYNNLSPVTNLADIPGYDLSRVIFDAAWAVILGLNNSMQPLAEEGLLLDKLGNKTGINKTISDIIRASLDRVKFSGLSVSLATLT